MTDAVDAVLASWRSTGVRLQAGLAKESVVAALAAIGHEASSDVIRLYERSNGMIAGESDAKIFAFWPMEQVTREAGRFDSGLIPFADFLISSHEYCFHYESPQRSSVFVTGRTSDGTSERVADSVEEFFALLMHDPEKVHVATFPDPPARRRFWSLLRR